MHRLQEPGKTVVVPQHDQIHPGDHLLPPVTTVPRHQVRKDRPRTSSVVSCPHLRLLTFPDGGHHSLI